MAGFASRWCCLAQHQLWDQGHSLNTQDAGGAAPCSHPSGIPAAPSVYPSLNLALFPSQLKSQAPGSAEELRCLQALNQQPEGSSLEELSSSQGCLRLASTIKAYVATVSLGLGEDGRAPGCPRASVSPSASPEQWQREWPGWFKVGMGFRPHPGGAQRQRDREGEGGLEEELRRGDPCVTFNQGTFSSLWHR